MTRNTTTQPAVAELWAAYERQKEQVNVLSDKHSALCEQAHEVHEAFKASNAKLRELFNVAYEAEFGRKYDRTSDKVAA